MMSDNDSKKYNINGENKSTTCNSTKTCQHHIFKGCNEKEDRCEGTPSKKAICEATKLAKMIMTRFQKGLLTM